MSFSTLGLSSKVLSAVESAGYTTPTAIQAGAIPHVLERRDVLGIAQTGTGKTASFTLPMLTLLETGRARARMPRSLILEPTRELAAQVKENFDVYGKNHNLSVALLIGGVSFDDQNRILDRGADVLIATPGRLIDHLERGKLLLQGVDILVIDEADRMLDMGFIPDIEKIVRLLPFTRQTLFFSATMPPEIQRISNNFLQNPAHIEVAPPASTADTVKQMLAASGPEPWAKREKLRELLKGATDLQNAIIFCNRKRDVTTLLRSLQRHKFNVCCLHGDMDQNTRMATLENFKNGKIPLLVASDVAARGLDIPEVSHVFNYDVPTHAEYYVHRIGRTGRAGKTGEAYMIVTHEDEKHLAEISKLINIRIDWVGEALDFTKVEKSTSHDKTPKRGRRVSNTKGSSSGSRRSIKHEPSSGEPAENSRSRPKQQKRSHRQEDEKVIGLGDHVPAFLQR